ncbi:MAG: molecular chaperone DnaJ [Anaeromyxobacteraceae bacterium]
MQKTPAQVLAPREGAIAETPLPVLLAAIAAEERTLTLELRVRALEKRIQFEDGSPVACRSNLLHETLGRFLVEKGKLAEDAYQRALQESAATGRRMGEVLVAGKLVAPFELYRLMQQNLALKILDAFRWVDARWKLSGEAEAAELALRVNPAQLVLTGCATFLPFEIVAGGLELGPGQRLALAERPRHDLSSLKLSSREARLVKLLRDGPAFEALPAAAGLDPEETQRRLYALSVLGIVRPLAPGEAPPAPAPEPAAPAVSPAPAAAAPAPAAAEPDPTATAVLVEETEELRNDLAARWLEHRGKDPFDLLGVPEAVTAPALRGAFLALADRFAPLRFTSADLREKAEGLLAAHARAYGALSDAEQAGLWRKRRAAAAEKARGQKPKGAAEAFRIQTDLLDAGSQFQEGLRKLQAGQPRAAVDLFQYAADIEPRASHRAHLAWARYLVDVEHNAPAALRELGEIVRTEPASFDAAFFQGEVMRAQGLYAEAEEAYRRAQRASPRDPRPQALALEMLRLKKQAR